MNLNFESKARSLINRHFARPDWIDIGTKDCFVCGTPIDKDEFEKRSRVAVNDLAEALRSVHDEAIEKAAITAGYLCDYSNKDRCRMEKPIEECKGCTAEKVIRNLKGPKTS